MLGQVKSFSKKLPGLTRFVKLDRKRRRKYGVEDTDPMTAYDMSSGDEAEEEMEVDEMPAGADASNRMAHAELYGSDSIPGGGDGPAEATAEATAAPAAHSDSNTREYLSSLPGSPVSDNEPPNLPTSGVDWNDFMVIYAHLPPSHRERAKRVQEVGLFNHQVLKEYLQTHLMSIFPGQPDLLWDYGAWWTQGERRDFGIFNDIVVRGMYQSNWGSFVEQWFIQQDYESSRPTDSPWDSP